MSSPCVCHRVYPRSLRACAAVMAVPLDALVRFSCLLHLLSALAGADASAAAGGFHPRAERRHARGSAAAGDAAEGVGGVAGARCSCGRRAAGAGARRAGPRAAHAGLHLLPVRGPASAGLAPAPPSLTRAFGAQGRAGRRRGQLPPGAGCLRGIRLPLPARGQRGADQAGAREMCAPAARHGTLGARAAGSALTLRFLAQSPRCAVGCATRA